MGKKGMKRKKGNQSNRHVAPETTHEPEHEPGGRTGERAGEESRQQSLAARERATRTQMSAGQTKVQRLHKGNQPRGR